MKKKIYLILSTFLIIILCECAGYKPIFSSTNLNFIISDHTIEGDVALGNQIFYKLKKISQTNQNKQNVKNIYMLVKTTKDKTATVKDSAGKIQEYKITLNVLIKINDYLTNNLILDNTFVSSISYKIQDNYSETVDTENRALENLINKTYQDILIKISQSLI